MITEYEQLLSTKAPTTAVQTTVKYVQHAEDLKGLLGETDDEKVPLSPKPADLVHEKLSAENPQNTEKKDKPKIKENKSANSTALDSTENEVCGLRYR